MSAPLSRRNFATRAAAMPTPRSTTLSPRRPLSEFISIHHNRLDGLAGKGFRNRRIDPFKRIKCGHFVDWESTLEELVHQEGDEHGWIRIAFHHAAYDASGDHVHDVRRHEPFRARSHERELAAGLERAYRGLEDLGDPGGIEREIGAADLGERLVEIGGARIDHLGGPEGTRQIEP